MPDIYPSNSMVQKENQQKTVQKPPEKVVKGSVTTRKKSLGKRLFGDIFLWGDIQEVIESLYENVIVPKAKDILSSLVLGTIYRSGKSGNGQAVNQNGTTYTTYSAYRNQQQRQVPAPSLRNLVDDIILADINDARNVLSSMGSHLESFGVVTVGYLYSLLGYDSDHTKENYGWYNLSDAVIVRVDNGYMLRLPRPVLLSR